MRAFFENLSPDDIETLDHLARLLMDLRDSHTALLARHGVNSEDALVEAILARRIPEHPAYEDYLGARYIHAVRESLRTQLKEYMLNIR